ncbi:agmatine hydroxycinnamoyltransferase 1-like [Nicotiana tabacum]|uniref:Agmatine coumaroyltransferase-2-like n=1 Tax=Nicotiana tabacum TaxID=4097 RepID=A0A1S3X5R7_TOBAC|nr:agmatine hydroxycinnamoyltransferase 1-like [Nicotiana tomentosiformis]XP_016435217.1 PREDICTED: agmatine coumaroyltransferase-2-like [Nicotiana tabacum]
MKIRIESSRIIKPFYENTPPPTTSHISLSVFDKVTYDAHIAIIYAYRPPTPPNAAIELGFQKALAIYREWAGRLGKDEHENPVIQLNDEGVRFVEASVDSTLDQVMPYKPSPSLLNLHPSLNDVKELVQVQLTRFTCGSLVVGFTAHHTLADGHSTSNFLVAWGQACRGLRVNPLPLHDRTIFNPRNPPMIEYNHKGVEFMSKFKKERSFNEVHHISEDIVVHKVHFTVEFLAKLKAKASSMNSNNKPYSTFESLVAHLWRSITKARGLSGFETTQIRISVNGRTRLNPRIPNEYFGNLVLWAFPTAKVKDLLLEPLSYATKLIHDAVTKVNNNYFKSFIDFANTKVKEEDLISTADMNKHILCPNIEVDSWLRFPFYDLDFGTGCPYIFMPSYFPTEGMMFLVPSFIGDGSIDVFIPLFEDKLPTFKKICYSLDLLAD